jgi:hypothetical protein
MDFAAHSKIISVDGNQVVRFPPIYGHCGAKTLPASVKIGHFTTRRTKDKTVPTQARCLLMKAAVGVISTALLGLGRVEHCRIASSHTERY